MWVQKSSQFRNASQCFSDFKLAELEEIVEIFGKKCTLCVSFTSSFLSSIMYLSLWSLQLLPEQWFPNSCKYFLMSLCVSVCIRVGV